MTLTNKQVCLDSERKLICQLGVRKIRYIIMVLGETNVNLARIRLGYSVLKASNYLYLIDLYVHHA